MKHPFWIQTFKMSDFRMFPVFEGSVFRSQLFCYFSFSKFQQKHRHKRQGQSSGHRHSRPKLGHRQLGGGQPQKEQASIPSRRSGKLLQCIEAWNPPWPQDIQIDFAVVSLMLVPFCRGNQPLGRIPVPGLDWCTSGTQKSRQTQFQLFLLYLPMNHTRDY